MKRIAWILLILTTFCCCKKDQLQWQYTQQIQTGTNARFNRFIRLDDSVILAVGGEKYTYAALMRSADNGNTWQLVEIPGVAKGLYGVAQAPDGVVYACGMNGRFVSSTDKGLTWVYRQMQNNQYNTGIAFPTSNTGIVISSITQDSGFITHAGTEGQVGAVKRLSVGLNDIKFHTPSTGYICGLGAVMRSTDTGNTWTYTIAKNDNFVSCCFYANGIWACGYNGSIWHSPDDGVSWQCQRNGNDMTVKGYHLADIYFISSQQGYAVGETGAVIYTRDGGANWSSFVSFTKEDLTCVLGMPDGSILVGGNNGTLYRLHI